MQNSTDNISIFNLIERAHAKLPDCAIILDHEQETALRKAIRNSGGGDIVPMIGHVAPTYTGRAVLMSGAEIAVTDAPILGSWSGVTLLTERDARLAFAKAATERSREAVERARESVERAKGRTVPEKIVASLLMLVGDASQPEPVRVAACNAVGSIGTALAAG